MEIDSERRGGFATDGYCVVEDLFTPAECEAIIGRHEAVAFTLDLGRPEDGTMTYRPMAHLVDPELAAAATDRRWADVVFALLGPDARLYWEQAVGKAPGTGTELPWHQDNGYTPLEPEMYLTCWLALDDADAANGALEVLPGSHRQGTRRHHDNAVNPYFRVGSDAPAGTGTTVPVRRGSVLCFSSLLLHRSGPNTTADRPRRSWIVQFCPADARSALSGRVLDDRLLVARDGRWLDEPVRARDFDLMAVLANYQRDPA